METLIIWYGRAGHSNVELGASSPSVLVFEDKYRLQSANCFQLTEMHRNSQMLKLNFENFLGRFSQTLTLGVGYSAPPLYRPQSFICDEVPSVCVFWALA